MFFPIMTNLLFSTQTGQMLEPAFVFNADGYTFDRTSAGFQFSSVSNKLSCSLSEMMRFFDESQNLTVSSNKLYDIFELRLDGDAEFQEGELLVLRKLAQLPLPNLAILDLSGRKNSTSFLRELAKNKTLRNLRKINAERSDIDLETLESFQSMEIGLPLIRDLPRRSEKYGISVAPVIVKVGNTKLAVETDEQKRYRFSILDRPIGTAFPIRYISNVNNSEEAEATIQILTQL